MLVSFLEAVLRSLILALVVWAALRIFRIQNVESQRYAWIAVLVGSLLMPIALPFTARWQALPPATIPVPVSLGLQSVVAPTTSKAAFRAKSFTNSVIVAPQHDLGDTLQTAIAISAGNPGESPSFASIQLPDPGVASAQPVTNRKKLSLFSVALLAYFLVTLALLVRLLFGLACALRLWYSSTPIPSCDAIDIPADLKLRFSHRISTPVTIGSGVVLPAGYTSWSEEKRHIVLAHERSHVTSHDFHLQILASLYTALTWFSPLGWWLKRNLSDLGEAISDRSGLNAASNRSAYAQILLEFASEPRPTLIGVAMARPSSIARRIEKMFNDRYLRQAFSGSASARIAVLVLPAILFAAGALVRVQAATQSRPIATVLTAPPATSPLAQPAPLIIATPETASTLQTRSMLATTAASTLPSAVTLPELALVDPPAPPALVAAGTADAEATFDRSLSFSGTLDLSVETASGNITFTRGAANQIRIHGIVKANKGGDPAHVQQIASNPPIVQNGNTIRIGAHDQNLKNISISYVIEAPADTLLNAVSASGDIANTGVGNAAKMITASGNINASGLQGGFKVQTASGDIAIDNSGRGDAWAQTGSGDIDLKGVNGALTAQTGSGTIKAVGTPSSPWKLQAGSGDIQLTTGSAPMNLDASTGSGDISAPNSSATQSSKDHHHLQTQLNGGGPEVRAETGSGDIRID